MGNDNDRYRQHYVRVTNNLDVEFTDMFDGVPLALQPGESSDFDPEIAAHIFGYHEGATFAEMLKHTTRRQGWNTKEHLARNDKGKTLAEQLFAKLVIVPVVYKLVEERDPAAPIPAEAPPPPKGRTKADIEREKLSELGAR